MLDGKLIHPLLNLFRWNDDPSISGIMLDEMMHHLSGDMIDGMLTHPSMHLC